MRAVLHKPAALPVLVGLLLIQRCNTQICSSATGNCSSPAKYGCDPTSGAMCCKTAGAWKDCPVCPAAAPTPSSLFGCSGELWDRGTGRLLDWSHAGYMYGDYNPPQLPWLANIKTVFGAKGDGVSDDTAAFEYAFSTIASEGALLLPAGTYVITRRLDIDKRIFLQGEGPGKTVLYFPKSLQDVYGNTFTSGVSQYAFGPGFINFNGADFPSSNTLLAKVISKAAKGSTLLTVDKVDGISTGMMVRLVMDNTDNKLLSSLNQGMFAASASYNNRADIVRWSTRVKAVYRNPYMIELERTLPFDVETTWSPEVHFWVSDRHGMKRNNTGVSDLTVRFPGSSAFAGEGQQVGYNGIYFYGTAHSWVRNVVFENAELGVAFDSASFNTVDNITFTSTRPTSASNMYTGGYGIWLKNCFDHLVTNFNFSTNMKYEVAVMYFSIGNVIANGRGIDLTLELMYGASYGNLFTNIHLGKGSEPFGWVVRGQDASGYNTFWNIRTTNDTLQLPPATWAPRVTFVHAENAVAPAGIASVDWLLETRVDVWPYDLWSSMRKARGRPLTPPSPTRYSGPGYGCMKNATKCCFSATSTCPKCPADAVNPSGLWGCGGELWSPRDRLGYDWGFAGYQTGSFPPILPVKVNIRTQYGARGDGRTDDTQALLNAVNDITGGVIYIPAGVYIITSIINIRKPVVIRGDGEGKTILYFPKSMTELYGNTWSEGSWSGTSQYSHGTGFINIGGWDPTGRDFTRITRVTSNSARGERVIKVADTTAINVGQWVRIFQKDPGDGSLMFELNGNVMAVSAAQKGHPDPCRFMTRVVAKGVDWIRTERVVPFKIDLRWTPEIHRFMPMLNDGVGFEHFTMEFPWTTYSGHFLEQGYNGLHMNQVVNGWIRNVTVKNSDMGIYLWGCVFTTIDNVTLTNTYPRGWFNGHRGIWLEHGSDTIVKNFNITDRFVHDITVTGTEHGTTVFNGVGYDINLDHHKMSPYQNLFTNIDLGLGTRVFDASGDNTYGSHSAYFSTFHNLQADLRYPLPKSVFGPNLTFIGLPTDDPADPVNLGWYVEKLSRPHPQNLYTDFKKTRGWRNPST